MFSCISILRIDFVVTLNWLHWEHLNATDKSLILFGRDKIENIRQDIWDSSCGYTTDGKNNSLWQKALTHQCLVMFRTIIGDHVISVTNGSCLIHSQSIYYPMSNFYDTTPHDTLQHNSRHDFRLCFAFTNVYITVSAHGIFTMGFHGKHIEWNMYIHFARMFFLLS